MKLRIGTRGSRLALWQAEHVAAALRAEAEVEIVVLETRGDRIQGVPLSRVEGQAFFTAEIERALLEERVDLAVHSHKDLATESPPGLVIAAIPRRGPTAERLLILPEAGDPDALFLPLKRGARVGTSAPRRRAQLLALRPDLEVVDLRGNVPTRVDKLRARAFDATVLAAAGLERLGLDLSGLVDVPLSPTLFVPAPAQGALAEGSGPFRVRARAGCRCQTPSDEPLREGLPRARACVGRVVMKATGGVDAAIRDLDHPSRPLRLSLCLCPRNGIRGGGR